MNALKDLRIVITRPRKNAGSFAQSIRSHGAQPIIFPTIEISPLKDFTFLDHELTALDSYDWIVFTSANAVDALWNRLQILETNAIPGKTKIAAIGPKTGLSLEIRGVQPDFIPAEYTADYVAPGMGDLVGKRVLLPTGNLARDTLPNAIRLSGGFPKVITAYNTLPEKPDPAGISALRSGVDAITFTSSSSAVNFVRIVQNAGLEPEGLPGNPIYACIGPITAKSAEELGLHPEVIAADYTVEGLVNSLRIYYQGNKTVEKVK